MTRPINTSGPDKDQIILRELWTYEDTGRIETASWRGFTEDGEMVNLRGTAEPFDPPRGARMHLITPIVMHALTQAHKEHDDTLARAIHLSGTSPEVSYVTRGW